MTTNGYEIQDALVAYLKKLTPYVRKEAGVVRFDIAAYIPDGVYVGFLEKKKKKVACKERIERNYCRLKRDALFEECEEIPREERERRAKPVYEKIMKDWVERMRSYEPGFEPDEYQKKWRMDEALNNIPQCRLGDKEYMNTHTAVWMSMKESCFCDNTPDCPTLIRYEEEKIEARKKWGTLEGFHLFEVKGDKDTFVRLAHQIPMMTFFADYVWLVLAESQPIPEWLPPYVGVLRYVPNEENFMIERKGVISVTDKESLSNEGYRALLSKHVLDDHGFNPLFGWRTLIRLYQKWLINTLFRWENKNDEVTIDMTEELRKLATTATWVKELEKSVGWKRVQQAMIGGDQCPVCGAPIFKRLDEWECEACGAKSDHV